ncbi:hypothetical protein [Longispora urticae]
MYLKQTLGSRRYGGVIGDGEHLYGYHLGKDRIFSFSGQGWSDYSVQTLRDLTGLSDRACAIDIGNDWPDHRDWLMWLISECRKGNFPDIREIIGTLDGERVIGWDAENHWLSEPGRGDLTHLWHTHISFYRDAADRDQTAVLRHYFEPPQAAVKAPVVPAPTPNPAPVQAWQERPFQGASTRPHDSEWLALYPLSGIAALGVTAWILLRRMELGREDSQ